MNHFDEHGNAIMVDVSAKDSTERIARAHGYIHMNNAAFAAVRDGTSKKGDVLNIARIAGIMAAKRTSDIIPLCHPLSLTQLSVDFELCDGCIEAVCCCSTTGRTGVEMEALTGVSAALLTIYDMCKALDRGMVMDGVCLLEKSGGRSGHYRRAGDGDA